MSDLPSGTVTFLFTDIEGSTRMWEEHPDAMRPALARHDEILQSVTAHHNGSVFSKMGDGMAVAFASAKEALTAAIEIQEKLLAEPWPNILGRLSVRMGVHTGDAVVVDGQYLNPPLNRCARLMAIGHGGQVLVSGSTEPLVHGGLPEGVELVDLGDQRLRDLSEPLRVFEVHGPWVPGPFPPLRSLTSYPGNLPVQLTSFIGRERELKLISDALVDQRLVTLTGTGGVGKTATGAPAGRRRGAELPRRGLALRVGGGIRHCLNAWSGRRGGGIGATEHLACGRPSRLHRRQTTTSHLGQLRTPARRNR